MRRRLILAGAAGFLAGVAAGATLLRKGGDPMSGIEASGQDAFDAPEQRWSPVESKPKLSVERLQEEARLVQARDDILKEWPQIQAKDLDNAGDDPDKLVQTIAERTGRPKQQVQTKLRGLIDSATEGKASFPVT